MNLIVGATGQLGTAVIRKLVAAGEPVRAFVRPKSNHGHLKGTGIDIVFGDLRDPASLRAACTGADTVIATANTVAPEGSYSFSKDEADGYVNLVAAAQQTGVKRLVYMSVPVTTIDDKVTTFRIKRRIEQLVMNSGVPYTIVRGSLFMDDWLALIGSSVPLRGAEAATLHRNFWFSRMFMNAVGTMVEGNGIALIPGSGRTRHAFIALDDVATFLVRAAARADMANQTISIGGPQTLSWDEAVQIFGKVLGRPIRPVHTPAGVFRLQQFALAPLSPAASNLMGMNWLVGSMDTECDMSVLAPQFGVELTSVEAFLRKKVSLAATR